MSLSLLGAHMDPFADPEPHLAQRQQVSLRAFRNVHRFRPGTPDGHVSLLHLQTRHEPLLPFGATAVNLLWYNTFLMKAEIALGAFGVDTTITIEKKPALEARADELSAALNESDFDLIALGEVYTQDVLDLVLARISPPLQVVRGPKAGDGSFLGSGLCVLSRRHNITKVAEHVYKNKGEPLSDADYHARKAAMLTRVDIGGVGSIDLYSTHMHSGGDIPDLRPFYSNKIPSEFDKQQVRLAQCSELVRFINDTHDRRNVAIIVGDFNIGAHTRTAPPVMSQALLTDLWHEQYGARNAGPTIGNLHHCCPGRVKRPRVALEPCDERQAGPSTPGQRIDYVWVEAAQSSHRFNLDASPIKRMPFRRVTHSMGLDFLSDHIGLATTLKVGRI